MTQSQVPMRVAPERLAKHVYEWKSGGRDIKVTGQMVMQYLVQGKAQFIEEDELVYFLKTCQAMELDPFIREAYLIKYSSNDKAAIVVAAQTFRDRAMAHPLCCGWNKGLLLYSQADNTLAESSGLVLPGQKLMGAFFEATPKGWSTSYRHEVQLKSYIKTKSDGKPTHFWSEANQPSQIMKVAEAQGLRHLFGTSLRGLYVAAELVEDDKEPSGPLPTVEEAAVEAKKTSQRSEDLSIYDAKEGQEIQPEAPAADDDLVDAEFEAEDEEPATPDPPLAVCDGCGGVVDAPGLCNDCVDAMRDAEPAEEEPPPPGDDDAPPEPAKTKGKKKSTRKKAEPEKKEEPPANGNGKTLEQRRAQLAAYKQQDAKLFKEAVKNKGLTGKLFSELTKEEILILMDEFEELTRLKAQNDALDKGF